MPYKNISNVKNKGKLKNFPLLNKLLDSGIV